MNIDDNKIYKEIDYLTEDAPIPNQQWMCISFLSPEGIKNCKIRGLKVRGVYSTKDSADKRAKNLQELDPDHHVFVGEVGKWLPWNPDPDDVQDQIYKEKELQDLMKAYKENQEKGKQEHHKRKDDLLKKSVQDERQRKQKERLRAKLKAKQGKHLVTPTSNEEIEIDTTEETTASVPKTPSQQELSLEIETMKKSVKEKMNKLTTSKTQLETKTNAKKTIDENLKRIKDLYQKIKKK
jgi:hypothetical protein